MNETEQKIEEFMKSQDYKDICYVIDHVSNADIRNSCLEDLGYSIGINMLMSTDIDKPKHVILGKKGEFRVQSIKSINHFADCVICKK